MKNHVALAIVLTLALILPSCSRNCGTIPTNKKEIMDRFLEGTLDPSYVPAAFFIHYGAGKTTGEGAVQAHLEYFLQSNMDILKVQFEQSIPRAADLSDPQTWTPVAEDYYQPTLEVIKRIQEVVGHDAYVIPTIYSPFQVTGQALTRDGIKAAATEHPEELKALLANVTNALCCLARECKAIGIQGFYLPTQGGETTFNDIPGFFDEFVKPYDLALMNECVDGTRMNILHICDWEGPYDDLARYKDYPCQIVNTPIVVDGKPFTVADGEALFNRPVLGGMDRHGVIVNGTEEEVAAAVADALSSCPAGRTMLGAECTVTGAPIGNIQAAVSAAHHSGR